MSASRTHNQFKNHWDDKDRELTILGCGKTILCRRQRNVGVRSGNRRALLNRRRRRRLCEMNRLLRLCWYSRGLTKGVVGEIPSAGARLSSGILCNGNRRGQSVGESLSRSSGSRTILERRQVLGVDSSSFGFFDRDLWLLRIQIPGTTSEFLCF